MVAVMDVPSGATLKVVAATLPKWTAVAPVRFAPVIVTFVPPPGGPKAGVILVTAGGGAMTVKRVLGPGLLVPKLEVTVTVTMPFGSAGAMAVMLESEFTTMVAGTAPKSTAKAPVKLLPVMVTDVPPAPDPFLGEMAVTTGGGFV